MKTERYLYLLLGQSNMAGRGELGVEDQTVHPRVLSFSIDNEWELAIEPLTHLGKSKFGVGPGLSFGKVIASQHPNGFVGLVQCAVEGSTLKRWERGGDLYFNTVHRARLAMRKGTLAGVLWHQGESDCAAEAAARSYGTRLAGFIHDLRQDLGAGKLPVVVGQLGQFFCEQRSRRAQYAKIINQMLAQLPDKVPGTACVSSENLRDTGDGEHFNSVSQRELGRRFAQEMIGLIKRASKQNR